MSAALPATLTLSTISVQRLVTGSSVVVVIARGSGLRLGSGLTFSSDFIVQAVKTFGFSTVKVEPPVADEVSLVENGAIGAEEGVLGKAALTISSADMESLAFGLGISIISLNNAKK